MVDLLVLFQDIFLFFLPNILNKLVCYVINTFKRGIRDNLLH